MPAFKACVQNSPCVLESVPLYSVLRDALLSIPFPNRLWGLELSAQMHLAFCFPLFPELGPPLLWLSGPCAVTTIIWIALLPAPQTLL